MGEVNHGSELSILGLVQVPSTGFKKGNIINIENTVNSIDECLNELERISGAEINSALLAFSGISVSAVNNKAMVAISNSDYEITEEDKDRVLQAAQNVALPSDKTILQLIERQYIVDGYDGIKDPVGMVGSRLEVEVVLLFAAAAAIQNLQRSTARISLDIDKLIYSQLFVADAVIMPAEKEMGVVLIDIGAGITEVSVFEQGTLLFTSILPVGGEYITKDLAIVLRTSIEEACRIKESYGVASSEIARDDILVDVRNMQGKEGTQVSQRVIAEIIGARISEMGEMIYSELEQFACLDRLPGGVVLTGGGAQLEGLVDVLKDILNVPVRMGFADRLKGLPVELNKPQNTVALGALLYGARYIGVPENEKSYSIAHVFHKLNYWLKDLFT